MRRGTSLQSDRAENGYSARHDCHEQGLKELKREITCPLCLDTFREPKLLSCNHVYCKSPCLEALLVRSRNSTISCPECRVNTQVTANEVNNLRTAFHVNRLKEVVARLKKMFLTNATCAGR